MAADDLLFGLIVLNAAVFLGLAVWSARFAIKEDSPRLRLLAGALSVVSSAFVLGAVTRALLVATRQGWISGRFGDFVVADWHLVQSGFATLLGVAGVILLRRYSASLRAADKIASAVAQHFLDGGSLEQFDLTSRELEILDGISRGVITDAEIAEEFFIAPTTAGTHVKNIMKKTGVKTRRDLVFLIISVKA